MLELIRTIESENFTKSPDAHSELPPRTATTAIQAAIAVAQEAKDLLRRLVEEARAEGAS